MKKQSWVPRGGYAPNSFLTPRDARRVYQVMRMYRPTTGCWIGLDPIVTAVRKYERRRKIHTVGEPRIKRAVHWLVEQGYVLKERPLPFSRQPAYKKVYIVHDTSKPLPDSVPSHTASLKKRREDD